MAINKNKNKLFDDTGCLGINGLTRISEGKLSPKEEQKIQEHVQE